MGTRCDHFSYVSVVGSISSLKFGKHVCVVRLTICMFGFQVASLFTFQLNDFRNINSKLSKLFKNMFLMGNCYVSNQVHYFT